LSTVPYKETRKFSTEQVTVIYSAMHMVSKTGLAKLITNILFAVKKPPIPMKSFTNGKEPKEWLRQYITIINYRKFYYHTSAKK
jgi:hypothetical protein